MAYKRIAAGGKRYWLVAEASVRIDGQRPVVLWIALSLVVSGITTRPPKRSTGNPVVPSTRETERVQVMAAFMFVLGHSSVGGASTS